MGGMEGYISSITENCTDLRLLLINLQYFRILGRKILQTWKALSLEQSTTSSSLHLATYFFNKMVSLHLSTPFCVFKPCPKCRYSCQGTETQQSKAVHSTFPHPVPHTAVKGSLIVVHIRISHSSLLSHFRKHKGWGCLGFLGALGVCPTLALVSAHHHLPQLQLLIVTMSWMRAAYALEI